MGRLTVTTPYQLGDCGCVLETGDGGRPLFVECPAHTMRERRCKRCGHTWTPRQAKVYVCPGCHSPRFDDEPARPRKRADPRAR